MSARTIRIFITPIIFLSSYVSSWNQEYYYMPENIYRFASYLYQSGDYLRAAAEYQRYFFSMNDSSLCDSILFKIGLCFQKGGKSDVAISFYQRFLHNYPQSKLKEEIYYQMAKIYFQTGEYSKSIHFLENNKHALTSKDVSSKMNQLIGIDYLYQRRWKTAQHHFSSMLLNNNYIDDDSITVILNNFAIEGMGLKYKSEILAGLLSSAIPGTGKIYSGRYEDGLFSLFTIGFYFWQAASGFRKNNTRSVKGWAYGTFGAIFYLGNIYGSVVAAKIHNERIEGDFIHRLNLELKWE